MTPRAPRPVTHMAAAVACLLAGCTTPHGTAPQDDRHGTPWVATHAAANRISALPPDQRIPALLEAARNLDPASAAIFAENEDNTTHALLAALLMDRMARENPDQLWLLFDFAEHCADYLEYAYLCDTAFPLIARDEGSARRLLPRTFLGSSMETPVSHERDLLWKFVCSHPRAAIDFLLTRDRQSPCNTDLLASITESAFLELAKEAGPAEALGKTAGLEPPVLIDCAHMGIVEAWAQQDPDAATAWVATQGGSTDDLRRSLIRGALAPDGQQRQRTLTKFPALLEESARLGYCGDIRSAIKAWYAQAPEAAGTWVRTHYPRAHHNARQDMLAALPPSVRLRILIDTSDAPADRHACTESIDAWFRADAKAAEAWMRALPRGALRHESFKALNRRLSWPLQPDAYLKALEDNPELVPTLDRLDFITIFHALPKDKRMAIYDYIPESKWDAIIPELVESLRDEPATEACAWVDRQRDRLSPGAFRETQVKLMERLFDSPSTLSLAWSRMKNLHPDDQPEALTHYLCFHYANLPTRAHVIQALATIPDPALHPLATRILICEYRIPTPEESLALIRDYPTDLLHAKTLTAIAHSWAYRDIPAATAWIRTLPPGPARDDAIKAMLPLVEKRSPDTLPALMTLRTELQSYAPENRIPEGGE